jgi:radical SAM superfamily enzyme YgiQ (UPF0313 family)
VILLIACYELGHQPLSLAWPIAFLQRAGLSAQTLDLAVQPFDETLAAQADFVAISVPMHTALRIGLEAARRVRQVSSKAHINFFGLYALLNQRFLLDEIADSILGGEFESELVELARQHTTGKRHHAQPESLAILDSPVPPTLTRLSFPIPLRDQLPPLTQYTGYTNSNSQPQLTGYVEASRGCLHTCHHCPIVPVYNGRFFVVPLEIVLADIRQQVGAGARHITFGDPDFLNGPKHSLAIARALHQEFPQVTFDFTTKVEHILQHRQLFPEFASLGCTFVVSAIESTSDYVLQQLHKGHTAADIDESLNILDAAGIALQPTLVAFTPWTTLDDYVNQIEWIHERGLKEYIPPIQLSIRLLIPPGSVILTHPDTEQWLGALEPESFSFRWSHPDPRMDEFHRRVSSIVEQATSAKEPADVTHASIRLSAYAISGRTPPPLPNANRSRLSPPRLTEDWFC